MEAQTVLNKAGFSMADISQRSIQHSAYLTLGRMTYIYWDIRPSDIRMDAIICWQNSAQLMG